MEREHPALQSIRFLTFFVFVGYFCLPGSGSMRIRIHNIGILYSGSVICDIRYKMSTIQEQKEWEIFKKNTWIKHPLGAVFVPVLGTRSYYQCCGSGSGRIHIILQYRNWHPGHADPDPGCPKNLRIHR